MRKMALDVGDVRIGIATSDMMGIIASGYETFTRTRSLENDIEYLTNLAKEKSCDTFVLGLPINMDGTQGERVTIVKKFGDQLFDYSQIKVVYQDERLSTVSAERMLIEGGVRRDKRKQVIDKVASTIILQNYLDKNKF